MTIDDYRAFIAEGRAFRPDSRGHYLHSALFEEAGEVAGVRAKHTRDCGGGQPWDCQRCRPRLIEELGDLQWDVVELNDGRADHWINLPEWHEPVYGIDHALSLLAAGVAGAMDKHSRGHWCDEHDLARVMGCVDYLLDEMCMTRKTLAQANVDKLTIRRAIAAMEGVVAEWAKEDEGGGDE